MRCEPTMRHSTITDRIGELLFPSQCAFCGRVMETAYLQICDPCAKQLQPPPAARRGDFFATCISALPYDDLVRKSVIRLKMKGKRTCAETFGRLMAAQIRQKLEGHYDVITWVPVAGLRRIRRGYDQDQLMAAVIAETLGQPAEQLLKKRRLNRTQSTIHDAAQRRSNVANVFQVVRKEAVAGKRILLIDDVITTGATLSECSRVLLLAGAEKVVCATYAAANRKQ